MKQLVLLAFFVLLRSPAWALDKYIAGFNLTENGSFVYDAAPAGQEKTPAQKAVDAAKSLGSNHIILNVRATMNGPYTSEITPVTPPAERSKEALRIGRLIKYIKSQGMTAGLRPIFFVVGPHGEFPYIERQADGTFKNWWHGNIQPKDPNRWFESFRIYLDIYLTVARIAKADEFTLGAELYSMTVGIEDQWKEHPYGFPGRWLELLRYARFKAPGIRLMYDINFTDDTVNSNGLAASGGEFERWRYRLADLSDRTNPTEKQIWQDLSSFWKELDAIGLDIYRSLASKGQNFPTDENAMVSVLKSRADSYASQIDTGLLQIEMAVGQTQKAIIKELGFRSVHNGFIDPFTYAGSGEININHQAMAYEAIFQSFWDAKWPWFKGICFWEISVDPNKNGENDNGFSPIGKPSTEKVIRSRYFNL
ncbi:glycoside hydrolase family 113 [Bdellovibrio sp. HCB2-146]|uniref:glycoside hydrolase family 113 n=1 Tax=Bdellovibrio sp. HCB2-146 TaxID=3394362 RepID=UPI0039BCFEE9